jgi:hypothetical protein
VFERFDCSATGNDRLSDLQPSPPHEADRRRAGAEALGWLVTAFEVFAIFRYICVAIFDGNDQKKTYSCLDFVEHPRSLITHLRKTSLILGD